MARVFWWAGELVVGVLIAGLLLGVTVPATTRLGLSNGPWMLAAGLAVGLAVAFWSGERLRRSLSGSRRS